MLYVLRKCIFRFFLQSPTFFLHVIESLLLNMLHCYGISKMLRSVFRLSPLTD